MLGIFPLIPAYGTDYKSASEVVEAWFNGKDFQCVNGQYCSTRDFDGSQQIEIRYNKERRVAYFPNHMK